MNIDVIPSFDRSVKIGFVTQLIILSAKIWRLDTKFVTSKREFKVACVFYI